MTTLRLIGHEIEPADGCGSWGELVAWFSELVIRLDKGDLAGAVAAQVEIERHGFRITFCRRRWNAKGGSR